MATEKCRRTGHKNNINFDFYFVERRTRSKMSIDNDKRMEKLKLTKENVQKIEKCEQDVDFTIKVLFDSKDILVLPICGTNVEKKQFEQSQTKKQKKSMKPKMWLRSLRGFGLPVFPPTVFVGLDRKGEREEQ